MNSLLSSFFIDLEELIEDLHYQWKDNKDYVYNPNAFSKIKKTGSNIMFCCPKHAETNPSCGIKLDYPYPWNCFGCGASGNLASLVSHALGFKGEFQGELYIMKNFMIESSSERKPIDIEGILDGNDLDKKRSLLEEDVQRFMKKRHSYLKRRGFSDHTTSKYEVGYDENTQSITFPVRTTKGQIRFIQKRSVNQKGFLNESGIYKKDILYGLYYLTSSKNRIQEIFLNESITDTMACYQSKLPACAILGRILFKEQVEELVKSGIKTVNLFFDNDRHGVECTIKSYQLLSKHTAIRVNVVVYPEGHWGIDGTDDMTFKDANDLLVSGKMGDIQIVPYESFLFMLKHDVKTLQN